MSESTKKVPDAVGESAEGGSDQPVSSDRLIPGFEELQQDIQKRLRDNRRFLEKFMDDDFSDEGEEDAAEENEEDFEEL